MQDSVVLFFYAVFMITFVIVSLMVVFKGFSPFGKPPVNRFLYLVGKIAMFGTWTMTIAKTFGHTVDQWFYNEWLAWVGVIILSLGIIFASVSLWNLGSSTMMGISEKSAGLKTGGIYRLSRNPMYIGFFLMCVGGTIYLFSLIMLFCSIVAIYAHHRTILAEEENLKKLFGKEWTKYTKKVRRYF